MAIIVAVERGWVTRDQALERLRAMLDVLTPARNYHGIFPHFMNGRTGATIPFSRKDDGGDLVETSFLFMGLLCARQYFDRDTPAEQRLRQDITNLWGEAEWNWYTQGGRKLLYWHWSPNNGWALDHEIHGWNECLITYVMAASSPRYPVEADVYHRGFAAGRDFLNGKDYYGIDAAARHGPWRPAVLRALLLPRPRPARAEGSLWRLLGGEPRACAHQPRALRAQSAAVTRAMAHPAGA